MKKLVNTVFYITLFIFLYMMTTLALNDWDRTKMNFLGYSPHMVMSQSMNPTLLTGDFVLAKQIKFEDVQVGDIVIYKHTYEDGVERAIVHRVIEKTEDYLIFQGDNNLSPDPWKVYPEDVRAKVLFH